MFAACCAGGGWAHCSLEAAVPVREVLDAAQLGPGVAEAVDPEAVVSARPRPRHRVQPELHAHLKWGQNEGRIL